MDYSNQPYQSMPGSGMPGMPGMPGAPIPGMPGQPIPTPEDSKGKKGKKGNGDGKPPTKKVVNRQFVIATVFALLAAIAVYGVARGTAPAGEWVVVAKGPIATNAEVTATSLTAARIDPKLIQPGAVTGPTADAAVKKAVDALRGVRNQYPLTAKEQIIPAQFGLVVNLGDPLGADERLVSFRATVGASVAGSIKPGDKVDLYASAGSVSGPIVYDVPIVSVTVSEDRYNSVADAQNTNKNARPSDLLPGDPVPGTYVVRVKADEVGKIVASDASAKIYLVYRGANASDTPSEPTSAKDAICAATPNVTACR